MYFLTRTCPRAFVLPVQENVFKVVKCVLLRRFVVFTPSPFLLFGPLRSLLAAWTRSLRFYALRSRWSGGRRSLFMPSKRGKRSGRGEVHRIRVALERQARREARFILAEGANRRRVRENSQASSGSSSPSFSSLSDTEKAISCGDRSRSPSRLSDRSRFSRKEVVGAAVGEPVSLVLRGDKVVPVDSLVFEGGSSSSSSSRAVVLNSAEVVAGRPSRESILEAIRVIAAKKLPPLSPEEKARRLRLLELDENL